MNGIAGTSGVTRRTFLTGCALASGLVALSGCKKSDGASAGEGGGKLSYFITNPPSIDPFNAQDVAGCMVARQLFDPMCTYDFDKQELVPCAGESWSSNDDGTVWTFKVKEGNTFHNGETVDAEAFKRAWNRLCSPKTSDSPSVVSYYLKLVKGYEDVVSGKADELAGVSCPDQYTLQVELSEPFMDFPMITSIMPTAPVPKAALDDFQTFFRAPIGNGPYTMDGQWEDGQYINLKTYEDYKNGDKPKIGQLTFNIQKDVETGYREFQAGNVDICDIPTAQVKGAHEQYGVSEDGYTITPGKQCLDGDQPSTYYLVLNLKDPAMADVNLRRAISLAIDRQTICDSVLQGTRLPATNLCPPPCRGYEEGQWAWCKYDPDQATAILDQYYPKDASGSRGVKVTLMYNVDGSHKEIMEAVQGNLNQVGIDVEQSTLEWASYLTKLQSGDFQMGRNGWVAEYPSIDNFLYSLLYTGNADNLSGYSNQQVDDLIMEARATKDDDRRYQLLQEANKIAGDDVPMVPLFYYKFAKVGSSRISHAYLSPIEQSSAATWELQA
ncbi:peptide ABC transporter substrate-binding protein [Caniella muris]|uniref:peptide ABC transporter substrate-binding protein n=1 Tax=Caniella muris TaxID=2941502 RepID=UPI00203ED663|nr:ABC transporter substrate-binding protein [Caniella muris]